MEIDIRGSRILLAGNELPWIKPAADMTTLPGLDSHEESRPLRILLSHTPDQFAWARRHDFDPRDEEAAGIWDTMEETQAFRKMTDGMKYFLGAVGLATLLIGGIGVMNVMLVAVR